MMKFSLLGLDAKFKGLTQSMGGIVLGMRLVGFMGTGVSLFYLSKVGDFGQNGAFFAFTLFSYALCTTLLFMLLTKRRGTHRIYFFCC